MSRSRAGRWAWLMALGVGCAHAPRESAEASSAQSLTFPPPKTAQDASWEEAEIALTQGRFAEAGHQYGAFADAFPEDPRADLARIQQAHAALAGDPDPIRGAEQAAALLARAHPGGARVEEAAELETVIETRRRLRTEASTRATELEGCRRRLAAIPDLERDRASARTATARLQQDLAQKERDLEDVKQRLLEIQQLAAEMLGVPKPPAGAGSKPPAPNGKPR